MVQVTILSAMTLVMVISVLAAPVAESDRIAVGQLHGYQSGNAKISSDRGINKVERRSESGFGDFKKWKFKKKDKTSVSPGNLEGGEKDRAEVKAVRRIQEKEGSKIQSKPHNYGDGSLLHPALRPKPHTPVKANDIDC